MTPLTGPAGTAQTPTKARQAKHYLLGLVGDARSLSGFWSMLERDVDPAGLERLGILAAALPEADVPPGRLDMGIGIPVYGGFREMLYMHPEINLVIETTGDRAMTRSLRKLLPGNVTLIERAAASFFINLLTSGELCSACRIDHQQTATMLTTVIDQMGDDILFLDADGVVLSVNQTMCNRLNLGKRQIIGRYFRDFFSGLEPGQPCPFVEAIATRRPAEATTSEVGRDGRLAAHRMYMYPIFYSGELSRMVAIRRNITERTELEQKLAHTRKLASIGELSTYIAHEIRNPMFVISGFANSLRKSEALDDNAREKLDVILEQSARLDHILTSLLGFTRPVEARTRPTDLNQAALAALGALDLAAEHPGVTPSLDLAPDLALVPTDPVLLEQTVAHLLKNGLEAMERDGTSQGILSLATGMAEDRVTLTVTDTGCGIPATVRDQVFSPFFTTKGGNAGIGLAMARKLMDDMDGDVRLSSTEGAGTSVTLLLPAVMAVAEKEETA